MAKVIFFAPVCHSVQRGVSGTPHLGPGTQPKTRCTPKTRYTPQDQVHPPRPSTAPQDQAYPPRQGTPPKTRHTPKDQVHPQDHVHPRTRYTSNLYATVSVTPFYLASKILTGVQKCLQAYKNAYRCMKFRGAQSTCKDFCAPVRIFDGK